MIASALNIDPDAEGLGVAQAPRMKDWRFWFAEHRGTLLALGIFVVMFIIYASNHPAGFTANVVQTASNKGVLLAFVAMAQTLVVLTAGIDLSVGMIFTLTNCLASWIVVGTPCKYDLVGVIGVLARPAPLCGAINGAIVIFGRLQPIVTTIATGAIYFGIALALRPYPGRQRQRGLWPISSPASFFGVIPASLVALVAGGAGRLGAVQRSVTGRAAYAVGSSEVCRLHVGRADQSGEIRRLHALGPACRHRRAVPDLLHLYGRVPPMPAATPIRCSRSPPWCSAACRSSAARAARSARFSERLPFRTIGDLLFVFDFDPLWQPLFQGVVLLVAVSLGAFGLFRVRNRLDWFR